MQCPELAACSISANSQSCFPVSQFLSSPYSLFRYLFTSQQEVANPQFPKTMNSVFIILIANYATLFLRQSNIWYDCLDPVSGGVLCSLTRIGWKGDAWYMLDAMTGTTKSFYIIAGYFLNSVGHSFAYPLTHSALPPTHPLTQHPPTHSLARSLTHSLTHSTTHSSTHSLTQWLTYQGPYSNIIAKFDFLLLLLQDINNFMH